jgi:hypothetical protein
VVSGLVGEIKPQNLSVRKRPGCRVGMGVKELFRQNPKFWKRDEMKAEKIRRTTLTRVIMLRLLICIFMAKMFWMV